MAENPETEPDVVGLADRIEKLQGDVGGLSDRLKDYRPKMNIWQVLAVVVPTLIAVVGGVFGVGQFLFGSVKTDIVDIKKSVKRVEDKRDDTLKIIGGLDRRLTDSLSATNQAVVRLTTLVDASEKTQNRIDATLTRFSNSIEKLNVEIGKINIRLERIAQPTGVNASFGSGEILDSGRLRTLWINLEKSGFKNERYLVFPVGSAAAKVLEQTK